MRVMLFLIFAGAIFARDDLDSTLTELMEPDEAQVYEYWLEKLFEEDEASERKISNVLRQRMIFSSTQDDWGLLTKARVKFGAVTVYGLMEQDMGEPTLTDHAVVSLHLALRSMPGTLLLGAFNARWGAGFLNHQAQQRRSLAVGSLDRTHQLKIRPHYSTLEAGYYQGAAWRYNSQMLSFSAYRSFRPGGAGAALQLNLEKLQVHLAHQWNLDDQDRLEWGVRFNGDRSLTWGWVGDGTGNMKLSSAYRQRSYSLSIQIWSYPGKQYLSNAGTYQILPSASLNEVGISQRGNLRPLKNIEIQWALDQGQTEPRSSLTHWTRIRRADATIQYKGKPTMLTGELGWRETENLGDETRWDTTLKRHHQNKLGLRIVHRLEDGLQYEALARSRSSADGRGLLVQQKLKLESDHLNIHLGMSRYNIDDSSLRISSYESSLQEGYGFFTAYSDGNRYFCYLRSTPVQDQTYEVRLTRSQRFQEGNDLDNLTVQFQLSVVF